MNILQNVGVITSQPNNPMVSSGVMNINYGIEMFRHSAVTITGG